MPAPQVSRGEPLRTMTVMAAGPVNIDDPKRQAESSIIGSEASTESRAVAPVRTTQLAPRVRPPRLEASDARHRYGDAMTASPSEPQNRPISGGVNCLPFIQAMTKVM